MPAYWLGLVFIFLFSVTLGWLPTGGMRSFVGEKSNLDVLEHMIMPEVVAGLTPAAIIARVARAAMLEGMRLDYMTALRAKGLSERSVILRHALRNALPTIVNMTGLQIGYLILRTRYLLRRGAGSIRGVPTRSGSARRRSLRRFGSRTTRWRPATA